MLSTRKKKLKIIPFFIALLIIVLVSFSVIQILQAKIKNIIITNGDYLKDDYIIDLAGIRDYPSFYLTNTLKIKKNLLKSPYIRNVKIKREFYHVLEIEVVTNRPLFINSATNEVVFEDKNTVKVDDEIDLFRVPRLMNYVPDDKYSTFIDKIRKSTRLNSSHVAISYAVFCLKKIKEQTEEKEENEDEN